MFYVFSKTPAAANTKADPFSLEMKLAAGVIHQVDVLFQAGCNHEEFVQIFLGGVQLWPSNRGEYLRGNATIISFREFFELHPGGNKLVAHVSTTLSTDFKEIIIQIGVLAKRIIQPLSFEELLNAARGL
ncbi:hypothetical protein LCGC14_0910420 [marine sediment metagenome]|uniref:Uncharacterized protein n=1 Tax=marine sediment metagenome TaxID=412755 RepID=A0A0F9S0M1_9ZZZZ